MIRIPHTKTLSRFTAAVLVPWCCSGPSPLAAQPAPSDSPAIHAAAKGPNQINLTWLPVSNPGYGFLIELQSPHDPRYTAWTELQPIPPARGYTCDSTIIVTSSRCTISDPSGVHVYNTSTNRIPYWVTDPTYTDPLDDSPAQFIASGLKPNTSYSFRVRLSSGNDPRHSTYGPYSNVATATTSNYTLRYVSPAGDDSHDGTSPDAAHAWRTLLHGSGAIQCGQALIVMGGSYPNDGISLGVNCRAASKAVVMVNPGDKAVITSHRMSTTVNLQGSYAVVDGITSASSSSPEKGDYDGLMSGHHNAMLGVEFYSAVIPIFGRYGVMISGDHNLLYRSYLHDYGSPDAKQNPSGNSGFVLTLLGTGATHNVIWSNHFTRGAHDTCLCKAGCSYNRWLNNTMDGGWGSGWMVIGMAGPAVVTGHNLFEGNFIKDTGQLVSAYKPSIEVSYGYNTVRRNVVVNSATRDLELSALYAGDTAASILVYNNTFYNPQSCIFQSHNGGTGAYDNELYANNICYKVRGLATDIYLGNSTARIIYNDIVVADAKDHLQRDQPTIIWNHDAQGAFQYPVTVDDADAKYGPVFAHNKGLNIDPSFVDEAGFDFFLRPNSKLRGRGTPITDSEWGSTVGKADLGAFGIQIGRPPTPR